MSRHSLAALSIIACIACFKGQATIGTCNADSECQAVKPGTTCNTSVTPHICVYSCPQLCQASELCLGGQCVQVLCVPACVVGFRCNTNVKPLRCEGLTIGTVTASGCFTPDAVGITSGGGDVSLRVAANAAGTLTINQPIGNPGNIASPAARTAAG